jgi:uncharacterized membrane protein YdbT with pleckstrin-like domain
VAFPDDSLTEDEHVVLHLHPHWSTMILPGLATIIAVALVGTAAALGWASWAVIAVGAVALFVFLRFAFWPFIIWRSTHFVFTNERVLRREGVFRRDQRDIPLTRVNDVTSSQNLFQRLVGSGALTVESAGERGQSILANIPKVIRVQKVVYELVEADHERRTLDDHDLTEALREVAKTTHEHDRDATPPAK